MEIDKYFDIGFLMFMKQRQLAIEWDHQGKTTLSSKISRRVASGIAKEAVIFEQAQCIITTSCIKPIREEYTLHSCFYSSNCKKFQVMKNLVFVKK